MYTDADMQPINSQQSKSVSYTDVDMQSLDNNSSDQSSQSDIDKQVDNTMSSSNGQNQQSPLNFMDNLRMAALNDPEEQQNYLKSKFKFAEPITDNSGKPTGQFNVGNDPNNLQPIHPGNMGDMAIRTLASAASMVPSVLGQIGGAMGGATLGTLAEGGIPGPGTVAGGIAGAGLGAGLGEFAKNAMISKTPGYNPQKTAVDNIVTAAFGLGGQAIGEAIGFGAKNYIAPKISSAIDGAIAKNPNGGTAFLSKMFKFIANVDPADTQAASQIGWRRLSANHEAWNPDEIDKIASDLSQNYAQREKLANLSIDSAEKDMKSLDTRVPITELLENLTDKLKEAGIVDKFEGDGENISSGFQFKEDLPSDAKNEDVIRFLKTLGAVPSDIEKGIFHIPMDSNTGTEGTISIADAINAKHIWKNTILNKDFNNVVGNSFKSALYGEGPSPVYPNGFKGIRSYINDIAQQEGQGKYIIANKNYENLMNAAQGVIKGPMDKNIPLSSWMDINKPDNVAKYLTKINKLDAFSKQALSNLGNEIGGNEIDRARQWATAQGISKASPQLLRLSVIGGLMGLMLPGSPAERASRVPMAFTLASPSALKFIGGASESIGSKINTNTGLNILNNLSKGVSSKSGTAVLSQLVKNRVNQ